MKNPKRKNDNLEEKWMPFLLPHEWLSNYLLQEHSWEEGMPEEGTFRARKSLKLVRAGEPSWQYVSFGPAW